MAQSRGVQRLLRGAARVGLAAAVLGLLWFAFVDDAFSVSAGRRPSPAAAGSAAAASPPPETYAPGPWWREAESINRVVFNAAHILVSHRDARVKDGLFWITGPAHGRTAGEAAERARELSARARRAPDEFAALARANSDDAASAPFGGNLGIVRGNAVPTEFIDALGRLRSGEVSLAFKTPYGYHVLRRLQVPPEQRISARQLVIAHRDAGSPRPEAAQRTREEARALAHEIAGRVARAPDQFQALIASSSDSGDASRAGDIGVWSTYEGGISGLLLHALATVPIGSFAPIVEDRLGFHVLLRTAVEPRSTYAAAFIAIAKGDAPLTGGFNQPLRSAQEARALAEGVARRWRAAPADYASLKKAKCDAWLCGLPDLEWRDGRPPPALAHHDPVHDVLTKLAEGEVAREPISTEHAEIVVQRRAPGPAPAREAFLLDLPRPRLELEDAFANASARELSLYVSAFESVVTEQIELTKGEREGVHQILEKVRERGGAMKPEERRQLLAQVEQELARLLGAPRHAQLEAVRAKWFDQVFN